MGARLLRSNLNIPQYSDKILILYICDRTGQEENFVLRKNLPGAILVCIILFGFIGVGLYLGISINWHAYFKAAAIIAVIAFIVSAIINTVPTGSYKK